MDGGPVYLRAGQVHLKTTRERWREQPRVDEWHMSQHLRRPPIQGWEKSKKMNV